MLGANGAIIVALSRINWCFLDHFCERTQNCSINRSHHSEDPKIGLFRVQLFIL